MKDDHIIYYQNPDAFGNEMGHINNYTKTTGLCLGQCVHGSPCLLFVSSYLVVYTYEWLSGN